MQNSPHFVTAADIDAQLQEKRQAQMAYDISNAPEQEFLFDVLGETLLNDNEQSQERDLETLNLHRLSRGDEGATAAGGAPPGWTAADAPFSPITNRGVSMYRNTSPSRTCPRTLAELLDSSLDSDSLQQGGYDEKNLFDFQEA